MRDHEQVNEPERRCGHCGRAGAGAWAAGARLCHTDNPALPDCYRRVTVWAEPVGALMALDPKPAGIDGIIRADARTTREADALGDLVALTEELGLYGQDQGQP